MKTHVLAIACLCLAALPLVAPEAAADLPPCYPVTPGVFVHDPTGNDRFMVGVKLYPSDPGHPTCRAQVVCYTNAFVCTFPPLP